MDFKLYNDDDNDDDEDDDEVKPNMINASQSLIDHELSYFRA